MKHLLLTLGSFIIAGTSMAGVIYVDIDASGNNDGSSWQNAYNDLQDALTNAVDNDSICIAEGIYYPTEDETGDPNPTNPREVEFHAIGKTISIFGGYQGNETNLDDRDPQMFAVTLSGDIGVQGTETDNCYRILYLDDINNGVLEGLTISESYSASGGGSTSDYCGLYLYNSSNFKIKHCVFENNETHTYGANYFSWSEVEIEYSTFTNNKSAQGGGFYVGGGGGSLSLYNTEISFNSCDQYGGAISNNGTTLILSNCVVHSNKSNSATFGGGAIHSYNVQDPILIINSTFVNNLSNAGEGNSLNSNLADYEIYNSIFWTTNTNSHFSLMNTNNSFTVNNSIEQGNQAYPQFTDTTVYDYSFAASSNAVDFGDTTGISQYIFDEDFYGNYRFDGDIDAGAFETCLSTVDLNTSLSGITVSSDQNGGNYQWIDCSDNSPVSGATNQSFTPSESGDYACIVTNGCVTDTTNCVSVTGVGLDEYNNTSISVYPNPTKNIVYVESVMLISSITLLDVTGKQLMRTDQNEFSVSQLPSGVYFIQVKTADQTITKKLIKE